MTATWKTFCHDPHGWIVELTFELEGADLAALLAQVDQAQAQLQARGYLPCDPYAAPTAARVVANLAGVRDPAGGNGNQARGKTPTASAARGLFGG